MSRPPVTAVVITLCTLLVVFLLTSTGSGASTKAPSFKVGTTWAYRHTIVTPQGDSRTGTMREVYRGETTYRGRVYHAVDVSTTLNPALAERIYHEWAGTHFRQVASVTADSQNNIAEIIFDRPLDLGVQANITGSAVILENGVQKATAPLSYTAAVRGTAKVTVPAGTFQTTLWDAVLRIGQLENSMSIYSLGIHDIRMESKVSVSGSLTSSWSKELLSGPVR